MSGDDTLIAMTACEVVEKLKAGEVTSGDLLDALEARIGEVDGHVNALPTLCFERAHARAARSNPDSLLAGLPVAIKDLTEVEGVLTTFGSPIFKDNVPAQSDILVETLERSGGVVYAKSNTPEFGAGANTFNEVFGATLNPWNTTRSAAGSSGGSAVALATGMAWLAHGSDMGGSLRNPASFCGIVGMRPSPGRVACTPGPAIESNLGQEGPMARTVEDLGLMLDAMKGGHPGDPISLPDDGTSFREAALRGERPKKVAFSRDFGITPVDPEVAEICEAAARRFADAGVVVEEAKPDFSAAHDCFQVLRACSFAVTKAELLENHRDLLKPEVIWNIEKGLALTMDQVVEAELQRNEMFRNACAFFAKYDLLLSPATIVAPYPVEQRYVEECDGHTFDNYVEWLAIAYAITLVCSPALSLPCGFTSERLPVGLQIAGPCRGEAKVLAGAHVLESILDLKTRQPIDPITA